MQNENSKKKIKDAKDVRCEKMVSFDFLTNFEIRFFS